jgi:hypothetical protein
MPPGFKDEGLKAALEARRRDPHLAVLVFSQYIEERYGRELLESGAEGTGYLRSYAYRLSPRAERGKRPPRRPAHRWTLSTRTNRTVWPYGRCYR